MLHLKQAVVKDVVSREKEVQIVNIDLEGTVRKAINYENLIGSVNIGDKVEVNTIANDLDLGSGGFDIVYFNHTSRLSKTVKKGHIIKERYTPWQFPILSIEEQDSVEHEIFNEKLELDGMPVAVGTLHSQLPAFCLTLKHIKPNAKIAYIMSDGAALPLNLSKIVSSLSDNKLIDKTITYGQAFGGDIEAVNIFTALIAAKHIVKADVAIVIMGPGITGTGTKLGFTGIEQGQVINAVSALGGRPVAVARISFADKRKRHQGISHHTITAMDIGCQVSAEIALPKLNKKLDTVIREQIELLNGKHEIEFIDSSITIELLKKSMSWVMTMGRSVDEESEFFQSAGAAAYKVSKYL